MALFAGRWLEWMKLHCILLLKMLLEMLLEMLLKMLLEMLLEILNFC